MSTLDRPTIAQPPVEGFDTERIRLDFPILQTEVNGKPLVYLDNGATTQKPRQVIEAISRFYQTQNANIHRGVYQLSQTATELYDRGRKTVARFINAASPDEIIFTRGTTESINLVAHSWSKVFLKPGDQVLISAMEHHSNIVPWQIACQAAGATLAAIPITDDGDLDWEALPGLITPQTRLVAITQLSNSLGTINDVKRITHLAHQAGAHVLVDGAQWVAHHPTDVRDINADFYAFSGHKLFGPTGIGVLYGKMDLLKQMPPFQGGGDMIESVSLTKTVYAQPPARFEAGTPNIVGVVGLTAAIEYLQSHSFDGILAHEKLLLDRATQLLQNIPGLRIVGTAPHKGSLISFVLEDPPVSSIDIGLAMDRQGIAVRTGHHCCQPVMDRMGISGTTRASIAMYNTLEEVEALAGALKLLVSSQPKSPKPASSHAPHFAIEYPQAEGESVSQSAAELIAEFELLEDREARSQYVIDLGKRLPAYFDILKTAVPRIPGCMSEVYLVARRKPGRPGEIEFVADANAQIVRGLIAILQRLFSGQHASEVLAFDIETFFSAIGLDQFISTQRRNGLAGMVAKIRQEASWTHHQPQGH